MTHTRPHSCSFFVRIPIALLLFAPIAIASHRADANILDYIIFKDHLYTQTANNVRPTTVDVFDYEMFLLSDPGDFGAVTLLGPGVNIPLTPFDPTEWEAFMPFGSQAALDAALPSATTYTLSTSGGTLGSFSESIPLGPDRYPTLAPYLSGNSFNDLSTFDVSQDLTINFGQPDPGDSQITAFSFFIVDETTDTDVFEYFEFGSGPFSGSLTLPGGTLDPAKPYAVEMEFATGVLDPVDGFAPVTALTDVVATNFAALTDFEFETAASAVPEPSTILLSLIGGAALCIVGVRRRRRR